MQPNEKQQAAADKFVEMLDLAPTGKEEALQPDFTPNPVLEVCLLLCQVYQRYILHQVIIKIIKSPLSFCLMISVATFKEHLSLCYLGKENVFFFID